MMKKKIWANFQRIIELFTQKIDTKLSKIWVWDPGSEIRKNSIPDPGSRGQKGTKRHLIQDAGSATLIKIKIFSESFPHFRNIHCTTVQTFLFSRMNKLKKAF
jgi:hypothetical protein